MYRVQSDKAPVAHNNNSDIWTLKARVAIIMSYISKNDLYTKEASSFSNSLFCCVRRKTVFSKGDRWLKCG